MINGVKAIDLMLNVPGSDAEQRAWYDFMKPLLLDRQSREQFEMPAQYLFKDLPKVGDQADYVAYTVGELDKHGIEGAMIGIDGDRARDALRRHPDRFFASYHANPNRGMEEVRTIDRLAKEGAIKAVIAPTTEYSVVSGMVARPRP